MRADTAQKVASVKEMSASMCVADAAFREGLEKLLGEYRFTWFKVKPVDSIQNVLDPNEVETTCGGYIYSVPEGWPRTILVSYRSIEFLATVLQLSTGDIWQVRAIVRLDRYKHERRNGWEPTLLTVWYGQLEPGEKKVWTQFDRRPMPSGHWVATPKGFEDAFSFSSDESDQDPDEDEKP